MILLLLLLSDHPFAITVSQYRTSVYMHYPHQDEHFEWVEVCLMSDGKDDDKRNPGEFIEWESLDCWKPRFLLEQVQLRSGTLRVRAELTVDEDGVRSVLRARATVKPEENPIPDAQADRSKPEPCLAMHELPSGIHGGYGCSGDTKGLEHGPYDGRDQHPDGEALMIYSTGHTRYPAFQVVRHTQQR